MLRQPEQVGQPRAIQAWQADKHQWQPAVLIQRQSDHQGVNHQPDPRRAHHCRPFRLRNKALLFVIHTPGCMAQYRAQGIEPMGQIEQAQRHAHQTWWTRLDDFRIAPHHDSVGVMTGMAPAPDMRLEQAHEAGDLIHRIVHPAGFERRAVAHFMPARIGGGAIQHPVGNKKWHTGPGAPEPVATEPGCQQRQNPQRGVTQGRAIATLHQFLEALAGDRALIPAGRDQAFFGSPRSFRAGQSIVAVFG